MGGVIKILIVLTFDIHHDHLNTQLLTDQTRTSTVGKPLAPFDVTPNGKRQNDRNSGLQKHAKYTRHVVIPYLNIYSC